MEMKCRPFMSARAVAVDAVDERALLAAAAAANAARGWSLPADGARVRIFRATVEENISSLDFISQNECVS